MTLDRTTSRMMSLATIPVALNLCVDALMKASTSSGWLRGWHVLGAIASVIWGLAVVRLLWRHIGTP